VDTADRAAAESLVCGAGPAMSADRGELFAIHGSLGWVETDDKSSPMWGLIPESVEKIALGGPVDDRETPIIWNVEDVEPKSEDYPTGKMGDEVPST
jgi:hypothetical protein